MRPQHESDWRRQGVDPEYRISLANERTFLAWIRTALAVLAGGVVLEQYFKTLGPSAVVLTVSTFLCLLAAALSALALVRWRANEVAMRHPRSLPATAALPVLATGLFIVSLIAAFYALL